MRHKNTAFYRGNTKVSVDFSAGAIIKTTPHCLNQDLQDFGVVNNQKNHINHTNHSSDKHPPLSETGFSGF